MESQASAPSRSSPGRQKQAGRLPQPPRRREEFAASSRLAGAGSKIANPASQRGSGNVSARGDTSARGAPASPGSTPSNGTPAEEAHLPEPAKVEVKESARDKAKSVSPTQFVDAVELARGGEVLLGRLGDLNRANADLKRQMELQAKEVVTLQEAGRMQQQLLRDFERQAEQARLAEKATLEAKVREEIGQHEVQLRAELEEVKEQARVDREEFMARLHQAEGELRHVEGERDEARGRIRELEERLEEQKPEAQVERTKGLEMELGLVRTRFAREQEAKKAAERVSAECRAQQKDLKSHYDKEVAQVKQLRKALAEESELANFRQEICNDLQLRLKDAKTDAEKRLMREKGKQEAVSRLEGILPRHFLVQALA